MNEVERVARAMNPTMRRIYLIDAGWSKGSYDKEWRHPDHPGSHTVSAAIRLALETEGR